MQVPSCWQHHCCVLNHLASAAEVATQERIVVVADAVAAGVAVAVAAAAAVAGAVNFDVVVVGAAVVAVFAAGAGEACQRVHCSRLFRHNWGCPGKASPKWAVARTCAFSRASLVARKSIRRQVRV